MASKEFKAEYRESHKGEYNIYLPDNKNPNSPLLIYLHGYYGEYTHSCIYGKIIARKLN